MILKVPKKTTKEDLDKLLKKLKTKRKKINLERYFGKVDYGVDGLTYQKKVRNEWK